MKPLQEAYSLLMMGWGRLLYVVQRFFLSRAKYDTVVMRLRGRVIEAPLRYSWLVRPEASGTPLIHILKFFQFVEKDPKVRRLIIRIAPISLGWAQTQSVARAIAAVTAAGIETVAFFERGGNREYYLAAQCGKILAPPSTTVNLIGVLMEMVYFKDLLDRIEVVPDMHAKGKYKSAVETFTRTGPSPAAQEVTDALADGIYDQYVEGIARARKVDPDKAKSWIDRGPYMAVEAAKAGIIDKTIYYDDLFESLKKEGTKPVRMAGSKYFRIWSAVEASRVRMTDADTIALVYAQGTILDGGADRSGSGAITDRLCKDLRRIAKDDRIKAVVLRVNSPGGSSLASDLIWRSLSRLREKKPLIVSMGDVAASGGYYISMPGQTILVESGTLTGSIGVIIGKFSLMGLYKKLGIGRRQTRRGEHAGIYSDASTFSESEQAKIRSMLNQTYADFVSKVAQARGMTKKKAESLAQGRVVLGSEAVAQGLADGIGGLDSAMDLAREKVNINPGEPVHLVVYPRPTAPWKRWIATGLDARLPEPLAQIAHDVSELSGLADGPQFRLPFFIRLFP